MDLNKKIVWKKPRKLKIDLIRWNPFIKEQAPTLVSYKSNLVYYHLTFLFKLTLPPLFCLLPRQHECDEKPDVLNTISQETF